MKTPRLNPLSPAFTLIELLVVISIIAVLASLSIPAATGVMVSARKAQARNDMSQISSAIKLYYTEYGRYPIDATVSGTADVAYGIGTTGNEQIISILRYKTSTGVDQTKLDSLNPRQIKFIEPKVATATKACVNNITGKWFDPWGTQYIIFIDADYAGDINTALAFTDITDKPSVSAGVASVGYSYVKRKTTPQPTVLSAAKLFDKSNDLLSWQ